MAEALSDKLAVQNINEDGDNEEEEEETPEDREKRLEQEAQMRAILNQQTVILYRQYAQEQHPKEPHKQEELIRQLQEQHFQQYITQVHAEQVRHQQAQIEQLKAIYDQKNKQEDTNEEGAVQLTTENGEPISSVTVVKENDLQPLPLIPASLWTRKDIVEFKAEVLKTQKECCIKIGSLATATIRVPAHPEGSCIFWEFATDYYDLGFGIFFEWSLTPSDVITVHISESSDDEGEDSDEEGAPPSNPNGSSSGDAELGGKKKKRGTDVPTDELIPVYRRDCHEQVYCGSHQYPGRGVYLLKFDNSYSLWRSKWLYYRVYYTK